MFRKKNAVIDVILPPKKYCIKLYYPSREWTMSFDEESERDEAYEQIRGILLSEEGESCFVDFTKKGKMFMLSNVEAITKCEE